MSERQAKLRRKNLETEIVATKKKSATDIIINIVIVLVVVALVGVGGWAVYNEYSAKLAQSTTTDNAEQQIPTIAQYAESLGITADDFMKEYGIDEVADVTENTQVTLAMQYMTLANYAKFSGMELSKVRESFGIDESVDENTLMSEIYAMLSETSNEESE